MNAWLVLLVVWLLAAAMMIFGWCWQRAHANAGIVDVLWSAGLGGAAVPGARGWHRICGRG
jgi:steroid 5-alpha reductase family enzyme